MLKPKELHIKGMVCNRCIKVIKEELRKINIDFIDVKLGIIILRNQLSEAEKELLQHLLTEEGFELVEDKEKQIVHKTKTLIIKSIHHENDKPISQNFSDFLSEKLHFEYSYLSKLFSEIEGKTIEHFTIEQKIERAKELIIYNELSLSEISYELHYSSPQHLSRQFKQITGLTPTQFKKIGKRKKIDTI